MTIHPETIVGGVTTGHNAVHEDIAQEFNNRTRINVKAMGAAGNGVDNDSTAITDAYDEAPDGAIMRWPAGEYMVDPDVLNVIASRRLEGDGQHSTWIKLRSDTINPAIYINTPAPVGGVRGVYGPMVKGIGVNLAAAPSAIGVKLGENAAWVILDDVRVEGGTVSFDNRGMNNKVYNSHFINPSVSFIVADDGGLELRMVEVDMTLTSGTVPVAFDVPITAGGIHGAIYMNGVRCNNGGTINTGMRVAASANISVPIRAFGVVWDNIAGPSWDLQYIDDVLVVGGWANSANGGNDPAVKIVGGNRGTFMGTLMNGGVGAGSGWASIEFAGGNPTDWKFLGNDPRTGYCYRLTGPSSGDPVNLMLADLIVGAAALANVTNEPTRLQAAMAPLWTPPRISQPPLYGSLVAGRATLVGGTVTVASTIVDANDEFELTRRVLGGTPGHLYIASVTTGVSFTISSTDAADTSTVSWMIRR